MDKIKIVMLGVQGSGKGTQAVRIAKKYEIPHISTGDMFREAIKNETELGRRAKSIIEAGGLVDDETTCGIVKERLEQADCSRGYILDGFPRTIPQAQTLSTYEGLEPNIVVNITLSDEEAFKRADGRRTCRECNTGYNIYTAPRPNEPGICNDCGGELFKRDDDNEEAIKARIRKYHDQTEPIKEFYHEKGIVVEVDGSRSIDDVTTEIMEKLAKKTG